MQFNLLSVALILQSVTASFNGDAAVVSSAASVLKGKVDNWSSQKGLLAALDIQAYFPTLSNAVATLSKDLGSTSDADIDPVVTNAFGASVAGLLESLTAKAQDFKAVGAGDIVKNDLVDLGNPSADIVNSLISILANDCNKINSLTAILNSIENDFATANSAYGAPQLAFSAPPSC